MTLAIQLRTASGTSYLTGTSGWTRTGGTDFGNALQDGSDASYVHDGTMGSSDTLLRMPLADPGVSLPDGYALKYMTGFVRASQASGNKSLQARVTSTYVKTNAFGDRMTVLYASPWTTVTPTPSIANFQNWYGPEVPQSITRELCNNAVYEVRLWGGGKLAEDHRVYELYAQPTLVQAPAAADLAFVDAAAPNSDTRPNVAWGVDSPDSVPQYEYRMAVWPLASVTGFPGGRTAFEANPNANVFVPSGPLAFTDWTQATDPTAEPGADLPATGAVVFYVQISGLHAGERLWRNSFASLDVTLARTVPSAPTSVVPDQDEPNFLNSITVNFPAQSLSGWSGRRVVVQRKYDWEDASAWRTLMTGTEDLGTNALAGNVELYDTIINHGRVHQYRARVELYNNTSGFSSASSWTAGSPDITVQLDTFVLRDPLDPWLPVPMRVQGDLEWQAPSVQGEFRPLGDSRVVKVFDSVLGKKFNLEFVVPYGWGIDDLDWLRLSQRTLVLLTDMTDHWYWVTLDADATGKIIRQTNRRTESKRANSHQVTLTEAFPPYGQPDSPKTRHF
jgi:hypothetical protein